MIAKGRALTGCVWIQWMGTEQEWRWPSVLARTYIALVTTGRMRKKQGRGASFYWISVLSCHGTRRPARRRGRLGGAIFRDVARLARVRVGMRGERGDFHFMVFLLTNAISAPRSWRLRQEINKGHTISAKLQKKKEKKRYIEFK